MEGYLEYYKEPNDKMCYNEENMKLYWKWIEERTQIYKKRVVENLDGPWTDDEILRKFKFTNAFRELDRLTLFYRRNIMSNLTEDTNKNKQEIMMNTMIYRLFVKQETWEEIGGYFHFDNWESEWGYAKAKLRDRKKRGVANFTDAYYVNGLRAANNDPVTCHDKTENAICLIELWKSQIEEITNKVCYELTNMKDCLKYLQTLCCVGPFTAYEYCCDLGMYSTTSVSMVPWDNDSYTNVGPGAKRGISWIFQGDTGNKGGLSDLQVIFWLRKNYEYFVDKYSLNIFIPDDCKVNIRTIEHALCEYQKYMKAKTGEGRPKVVFKPKKDIESLRL